MGRYGVLLWCPFCVHDNVAGWHGVVGFDFSSVFTTRAGIPAFEFVGLIQAARSRRSVIVVALQRCLILHGFGLRIRVDIAESQCVGVPHVVEGQCILAEVFRVITKTCHRCTVSSEPLNFMVFLIICCVIEIGFYLFQFVKAYCGCRPGVRVRVGTLYTF